MKTSSSANVVNGKRAFISQSNNDLNTSNFLTIPKGDYRYLNEPISNDVNMNNINIINCKEGEDEKDVCTINNLTVYYNKGSTSNMSNDKITNLADGTVLNDAVNFKQFSSLEDNIRAFDDKYLK